MANFVYLPVPTRAVKPKNGRMEASGAGTTQGKFGMAPVYFTSISSILGAILFLRLGYATGVLGFWGAIAIIVVGHLITIPTALSISELATNTRVEGGGEYFIISRSFGLKIGSTIGLTLFLAQAISIAFYTIAFAESFYPLFDWWSARFGFELPRQFISVPTFLALAFVILNQGSGSGVKMLYVVTVLLGVSLLMFFLGKPLEVAVPLEGDPEAYTVLPIDNFGFFNREQFFVLFAICFPAFTGMTAGVGLSGDLRNPGRAIPLGTMLGTLTGLVVYVLVVWKMAVSAPQAELIGNQMVMSKIALYGSLVIPLGLAASTSSSAIGAMLVAPRTLQAISMDGTFPIKRVNAFFARGRGKNREPHNASLISFIIALVFVLMGSVNSVAEIISMFFLITYGTLCLSSFLNHFGSPPSYRPRFRSRWYISLAGFLLSVWVMFMINPVYTFISYLFLLAVYLLIEHTNKDQKGLVDIFKGAIFQLSRRLHVFMQNNRANMEDGEWRPASICISSHTFEREKVLDLMKWLSYQHGFGTYIHFIEGYYGRQSHEQATAVLKDILELQKGQNNSLYIDTMVSPSYTSAIAQAIQSPPISGMENNMVVFEYGRYQPEELSRIMDNVRMVKAGDYDVCIFSVCANKIIPEDGIHVWISETDEQNTNFMILLGYIIISHPFWKKSHIRIFITSRRGDLTEVKKDLEQRIAAGRLPITLANIEIVTMPEYSRMSELVDVYSQNAALTIIGFHEDILRSEPERFFDEFRGAGDILFVNTTHSKDIG